MAPIKHAAPMTKQTRPTAIFRTKPIVILAASHFADRYFRPVCCCDPEVMGLVVVVGFMPLILFVMLLGVSSIFLVVFDMGLVGGGGGFFSSPIADAETANEKPIARQGIIALRM